MKNLPGNSTSRKALFTLKLIFILLSILTLIDLFILFFNELWYFEGSWYRPPLTAEDYFSLWVIPQNSYVAMNKEFIHYYLFSFIIFVVYFYWYYELNDIDEPTVPLEQRCPAILFNKPMARITEANWLVPLLVAVITGNLCPDGYLETSQALVITASIQICCYIIFCVYYRRTIKEYSNNI